MLRFRVLLLAPESAAVLNHDGSLYRADSNQDLPARYHDAEVDALALKDSLLASFPWAYVAVFDRAAQSDTLFHDELGLARYNEACNALQRWRRIPFFIRWLLKRPADPRSAA